MEMDALSVNYHTMQALLLRLQLSDVSYTRDEKNGGVVAAGGGLKTRGWKTAAPNCRTGKRGKRHVWIMESQTVYFTCSV